MKQITQFVFARLEYDFKDLFCSRFLTILFLTHLFFLQSSFSLFFFSLLLLLLQTVSLKIFISKYIISLIWSLAEQIYRTFLLPFITWSRLAGMKLCPVLPGSRQCCQLGSVISCNYMWKVSSRQGRIPLLYRRDPALPLRNFSR